MENREKKEDFEENLEDLEDDFENEIDEIFEEEEELEDSDISGILEVDNSTIDRALLSRFLSQSNYGASLDKRDISPTLALESDLEKEHLRKNNDSSKEKINYNAYIPEKENNKYLGGTNPGISARRDDLRLEKTPAEKILEEQKRFTKFGVGSQTFGSDFKEDPEEKYFIRETKTPKKGYNPIKEVN